MRLSRTGWVGVAVVVAGFALFGGWSLWSQTRTWVPIDMPISLSVGQIRTPEFKTNLKALYLIQVEVEKKIPFDTLNSLLGVGHAQHDTASVINASWVLSSQGNVVARGSTAESKGGSWTNNTIARQIGSFESELGRQYTLEVNVLANGTSLAAGNPRLKVGVHPQSYVDAAVAGIPVLLFTVVFVVAGLVVVVVPILRERQRSKPVVTM